MSAPSNPFVRQTSRRRAGSAASNAARAAGRGVTFPVRYGWYWVRRLPVWGRAVVCVAVAAATVGGGLYTFDWYQRRVQRREVFAGWRAFEDEARHGADPGKLTAALDRVLAASPGEPVALARKEALRTGTADESDQPMVQLLVRIHLSAGRSPDAIREAGKRAASDPRDLTARLLLADDALRRNDPAAAAPHLDAIAAVGPKDNLHPNAILYATSLFQRTGRDVAPLRKKATDLLPIVRGEGITQVGAEGQVGVVGCYAFALSEPLLPTGSASFWVPTARLADAALAAATAAGELRPLVQLAEHGTRLAVGLRRLQDAGQVTADERAKLAGELEARTQAAWKAARAIDPKLAAAHRGVALSHARLGQPRECVDELLRGLEAFPDHPQLVATLVERLVAYGNPGAALDVAWKAAERHPEETVFWLLAADAGQAAGRREKVIEACQRAKALAPDRADVAAAEARMWTESGRYAEAVAALDRVPTEVVARDPAAVRALAHALAVAGPGYGFDKLLDAARGVPDPASLVAVAQGVFDAPPAVARCESAAAIADEVLKRSPGNVPAALLKAAALLRALDLGPAMWDADKTKAAVAAAEAAVAVAPDDPAAAAGLAWAQLRGLNRPVAALSAAAPLRTADPLPADKAEVLGAVLLANDKPDDAIRVLETAAGGRDVPTGVLIQLARAYHAVGRVTDARATLTAASSRPQSARERADYQAAYAVVHARS